jgi:hypothetical protein
MLYSFLLRIKHAVARQQTIRNIRIFLKWAVRHRDVTADSEVEEVPVQQKAVLSLQPDQSSGSTPEIFGNRTRPIW